MGENMTAKRFSIIGDNNIEYLMQSKLLLPIYDNDKRLSLKSCCDVLNEQHETIRNLENELKGMRELLKSYRKTIEHDAELLADATKNGYFPPLEDWKGDVE